MCIVFLYFNDKPSPDGYRLMMASNRDEFYYRPTASAKFWDKNTNIIAGNQAGTKNLDRINSDRLIRADQLRSTQID